MKNRIRSLRASARRKRLGVGFSHLENHWAFCAGRTPFSPASVLPPASSSFSSLFSPSDAPDATVAQESTPPGSSSSDIFSAMKSFRFSSFLAPRLFKAADAHSLFTDAFPFDGFRGLLQTDSLRRREFLQPSLHVEVNFDNTQWEICAGQSKH